MTRQLINEDVLMNGERIASKLAIDTRPPENSPIVWSIIQQY